MFVFPPWKRPGHFVPWSLWSGRQKWWLCHEKVFPLAVPLKHGYTTHRRVTHVLPRSDLINLLCSALFPRGGYFAPYVGPSSGVISHCVVSFVWNRQRVVHHKVSPHYALRGRGRVGQSHHLLFLCPSKSSACSSHPHTASEWDPTPSADLHKKIRTKKESVRENRLGDSLEKLLEPENITVWCCWPPCIFSDAAVLGAADGCPSAEVMTGSDLTDAAELFSHSLHSASASDSPDLAD